MHTLIGRNVHDLFYKGMLLLKGAGYRRDSRNGPVFQAGMPVASTYLHPQERVFLAPWRDANPFFHLYEGLWMLAGREDVAPLAAFVKRMRTFSDDGETLHGAYGFRWRRKFGFDQLDLIISALHRNPEDRRQVLQMWSAQDDLGRNGKDLPCNLMVTFQVAPDGRLDMSVFCRSNDMIWGAYGANVVHFSMLQEYVATSLGRKMGTYTQMSVNFHAYVDIYEQMSNAAWAHPFGDPYEAGEVQPYPMMTVPRNLWDGDLYKFLRSGGTRTYYNDPFFAEVAQPMVAAHVCHRAGHAEPALAEMSRVAAPDWRRAGIEWIQRRMRARDDGPTPETTIQETR